jgi:aspartate aminotransferase
MTGWRIGFAGGPKALIRAMVNMQGQATAGISTVGMAAAVAALNGPQDLLQQRASILRDRRDRFVTLVNDCPGLACTAPEATFYLLVSCAGVIGKRAPDGTTIADDRDFAGHLLQSADLVVFPGEDFGMSPAIRVSFANPPELIAKAGQRLKQACEVLR